MMSQNQISLFKKRFTVGAERVGQDRQNRPAILTYTFYVLTHWFLADGTALRVDEI